MGRATPSDAELMAMWCFLQLSRVGWKDLSLHAKHNQVCFQRILPVCLLASWLLWLVANCTCGAGV